MEGQLQSSIYSACSFFLCLTVGKVNSGFTFLKIASCLSYSNFQIRRKHLGDSRPVGIEDWGLEIEGLLRNLLEFKRQTSLNMMGDIKFTSLDL